MKYDKNLVEVSRTSGILKMSINDFNQSYNYENKTVLGWHILKAFGQKLTSRLITIRQKTSTSENFIWRICTLDLIHKFSNVSDGRKVALAHD